MSWPQDLDARRHWLVIVLAVALALLAFAAGVALSLARHGEPPAERVFPVVTTATDDAGRVCTTATTPTSVAIDCDFPPAENRLGGWLDNLSTTTP